MSTSLSANTQVLMKVIKDRHSGRVYDSTKLITPEQLNTLIEAARWAPSCYGEEPWRFIICQKGQPAYQAVLEGLVPGNQKWASQAPVLIVVLTDTLFTRNSTGPNRWSGYDTGAAAQTMMLAAQAEGLMLHSMGGFHADHITAFFKISSRFEVMAVMALGHEASTPASPASRKRQPSETRFFFDTWKEESDAAA